MLSRMTEKGYSDSSELKEWGRGIDMEWFSPARRSTDYREKKGFTEADVVVLWAGRMVPEKRPDIFLETILQLRAKGYPVKALVVGTGTFERTLSQIPGVVCCGWLSGVALAQAYSAADVLLFPSDVETFGNVTLEALASGCPAIVEEKCGGHLIENGVNGFTCAAGDYNAFFQATKRVVADKSLRVQMAVSARQSAWKYEKNNILQQMVENYKDSVQLFADPSFITKRIQASPEAAGKNVLSVVCCNYNLVRVVAGPLLSCVSNAQQSLTNCISSIKQCIPDCLPSTEDNSE
jgi:phosphatidylinositol alpha 1,6-mannosyltransferase